MNNLDNSFRKIYGKENKVLEYQTKRYNKLYQQYCKLFGENDNVRYFSSPGRVELSGNHTDHNGGKVIAASINLDSIGCILPQNNVIEIFSEGFDEKIYVDLNELNPIKEEAGTSSSLVRGVAAGFVKKGYSIGGFKGVVSSDVLVGSGLSSSASFEVLVGTILNHFYNDDKIPMLLIAQIGQYSENIFFGKPCGLMDQIACAIGGVVAIDFKNNNNPNIEQIRFDLVDHDYKLLVVYAGASHQNLTDDYASIPKEMKEVAQFFGKENCSQISFNEFLNNLSKLYRSVSNRALVRAIHFFKENERVANQVQALKEDNLDKFLKLVNESGDSSFKYLQNIFSPKDVNEQPLSVALSISENFISERKRGACRVHGGGFAGTILVFLHKDDIAEYQEIIEPVFGKHSVNILDIRNIGATVLM